MPRGWLKHQNRSVGAKKSLGNSSKRGHRGINAAGPTRINASASRRMYLTDDDYNDYLNDFYEEDDGWYDGDEEFVNDNFTSRNNAVEVDQSKGTAASTTDTDTDKLLKEQQQCCPICCEDRPLIALMRECDHPPTCFHCLRQIYVIQAQQSVSNYPLKCYHPSCTKAVRETQLIKHSLVRTDKELQKHYRLTTLAKVHQNANRYRVVHCPDCDTPRTVIKETCVKCRNNRCGLRYYVSQDGVTNEVTTLAVLASLTRDEKGPNNGFARCPRCKIFISKGTGCDHMYCVCCGLNFSWDAARQKQPKMKQFKVVEATKTIVNEATTI